MSSVLLVVNGIKVWISSMFLRPTRPQIIFDIAFDSVTAVMSQAVGLYVFAFFVATASVVRICCTSAFELFFLNVGMHVTSQGLTDCTTF